MISFFWHRRDLRIFDNAGLYRALKIEKNVQPIFIFDRNILDKLDYKEDQRVDFIYRRVQKLKEEYLLKGSSLWVFYGKPADIWKKLVEQYQVKSVYCNRDYEPYACERDKSVYTFLQSKSVDFKGYKDHVIFEKDEVIKKDGKPYTVFTPYAKKWRERLNEFYIKPYPVQKYLNNLNPNTGEHKLIPLEEMGFKELKATYPPSKINEKILIEYGRKRDIPSVEATSKLSVHLRFGTISIRQLASEALRLSDSYLNELIWRDFYQMIIYHFPHSAKDSFKKAFDSVEWEKNEAHFKAWCEGKTGYPIVDAGMRQLNTTGFMHNRVRMITASFLTKHLLLDWRWGEAYFAEKLLDYEMASNVGGWQWAAGSGCDAAPYFRVFNPTLQQQKFDPDFLYIKKWVLEWNTSEYVEPIVEHNFARKRAVERYKIALKS